MIHATKRMSATYPDHSLNQEQIWPALLHAPAHQASYEDKENRELGR
jgi:hypothetical protein